VADERCCCTYENFRAVPLTPGASAARSVHRVAYRSPNRRGRTTYDRSGDASGQRARRDDERGQRGRASELSRDTHAGSIRVLEFPVPNRRMRNRACFVLLTLRGAATFDRAGPEIVVANVQRKELPPRISRVDVDATRQRVLAYDKGDAVVAVY